MIDKDLDTNVTVNELAIETEEDEELSKTILFVITPFLLGVLMFFYFSLNSIEGRNKFLKQEQSNQQISQDTQTKSK